MNQNFSYQLYPTHNLIHVKVSGDVQFESFLAFFSRVDADPNYSPTMNCLWDSREVTSVDGSILDFNGAAQRINDKSRFATKTRTAILLDSTKKNIEQYTKGFLLMASASNVEHKTFIEFDDAELLIFLNLKNWPWDE